MTRAGKPLWHVYILCRFPESRLLSRCFFFNILCVSYLEHDLLWSRFSVQLVFMTIISSNLWKPRVQYWNYLNNHTSCIVVQASDELTYSAPKEQEDQTLNFLTNIQTIHNDTVMVWFTMTGLVWTNCNSIWSIGLKSSSYIRINIL